MAIDLPKSDLDRSKQHNPEQTWPYAVKIQVQWIDAQDRITVRTETISANQFFGTGSYGAPLEGQAIIQMIERMRREGPPKVERKPLARKDKR